METCCWSPLTRSSSKLMSPSSSSLSSSSGASLIRALSSVLAGLDFRRLRMRCRGDCPPPGSDTTCCSRLSLCFLAKLTKTWADEGGLFQLFLWRSSARNHSWNPTHVVQSGLTDRVVLDAQNLHHLLHLTEDLSQRDPFRLQLVLDLGVVALLQMWGRLYAGTSTQTPFINRGTQRPRQLSTRDVLMGAVDPAVKVDQINGVDLTIKVDLMGLSMDKRGSSDLI